MSLLMWKVMRGGVMALHDLIYRFDIPIRYTNLICKFDMQI
jgi:hypothetical protein